MVFDEICRRIAEAGLTCRGAFHPDAASGVPALPDGRNCATLVLLGLVGEVNWPAFAAAPEARDGRPDPLDRWSRRVTGTLAEACGAGALHPFDGPPFLPFHAWAQQAEPVFRSPLGILIHPDWGLWHSYRGALAFADRLDLPPRPVATSPCDACAGKPCLGACPVGAFSLSGYDVAGCSGHLSVPAGLPCLEGGCRARRACPVGAGHRHGAAQAGFHMQSFLAAQGGRSPPVAGTAESR
jgi:ferredoxin